MWSQQSTFSATPTPYVHQPQAAPPGGSDSSQARAAAANSTRPIGTTLNFTSGQFNGRHVRAQLVELQKADLGRKYARKDRRPLDPPPVVQLRLFLINGTGEEAVEQEVEDYGEVQNMGLICHVDLFPVPGETSADSSRRPEASGSYGSPGGSNQVPGTSSFSATAPTSFAYTFPAPQPPPPGTMSTAPGPIHQPYGAPAPQPIAPPTDIVHYHKDYAVTESSKCTDCLAGTTFVQAQNLDYKGNKVLMFVFADLAVKMEGNFILRYRCFDLFSKVAGEQQTPVWAECYGGAFRVYSTKEFPGLRASTDLTKHLSYFGVRLNLRETERKRRKKVDDPAMAMQVMGERPPPPPESYGDGAQRPPDQDE
ncbi:unnamed protein product [Peniophora sp. CBMAI 1063]|nr:unnamed protein product [Peniophora sp. CBMAI 1063]